MRCTLASAAALAAALVVAISLWPENHAPINQAVGQIAEKKNLDELEKVSQAATDNFTAITTAKLDRFIQAHIDEPIPLAEFVGDWIKQKFDVEGICDMEALKQAGIDPSANLVNIHLSHVRGTLLLDLLLGQFNLTYRVRDGIIIVTTKDKAGTELEVRIYDTRNILAQDKAYTSRDKAAAHDRAQPESSHGAAAPIDDRATAVSPSIIHLAQAGALFGSRPEATAQPEKRHASPDSPVERLIEVITTTVEPETWDHTGG